MTMHSMWVTADESEEFLHVDDTIDAKRTQYVLSLALDRGGIIRSVRMESWRRNCEHRADQDSRSGVRPSPEGVSSARR